MLLSNKIRYIMLAMSLVGMAVSALFIAVTHPTTTPTQQAAPVYVDAGHTGLPSIEFPTRNTDTDITPEPVVVEPPTPVKETTSTPAIPTGVFEFPTVGMSAPIATTTTVNGADVHVPDFHKVFRITDMAAPVYTAHSCVWEHCLGNNLFNTDTQEVLVHAGDTVHVDGKLYKVTATRKVGKDALPYDPIWSGTDVAFVTCFQKTDRTPSTDNLVVVTTPVS